MATRLERAIDTFEARGQNVAKDRAAAAARGISDPAVQNEILDKDYWPAPTPVRSSAARGSPGSSSASSTPS